MAARTPFVCASRLRFAAMRQRFSTSAWSSTLEGGLTGARSFAHHEQMQNLHLPSHSTSRLSPTRPDVTAQITRGAVRLFADLGVAALGEVALPNGRRADLLGIDERGRILIAEVKSGRADFEADMKWAAYLPYCDAFYFAVARDFPIDLLPASEGLIIADAFGGAILRASPERPLVAARRKALTIRFARLAAARATGFGAEIG
jgi:hypothetical protein